MITECNEFEIKLLKESEKITGRKYKTVEYEDHTYTKVETITDALEDLIDAYNDVSQKLIDFTIQVEDNYKPITKEEMYEYGE